MNRIKVGDYVTIISGKDKGKKGTITKLIGDRVIVENANIVKKHTKPTRQGEEGAINKMEALIHISNVALYNKELNKPSKVGFKILENGEKIRFYKINNQTIESQV